jgi:hypothetical protein
VVTGEFNRCRFCTRPARRPTNQAALAFERKRAPAPTFRTRLPPEHERCGSPVGACCIGTTGAPEGADRALRRLVRLSQCANCERPGRRWRPRPRNYERGSATPAGDYRPCAAACTRMQKRAAVSIGVAAVVE